MLRSNFSLLSFILVCILSFHARSSELFNGVSAAGGELTYVVCTSSTELNVRNESLSKIIFKVAPDENALPMQSFGQDRLEKTVNGKTVSFIKVQFPDVSINPNFGWVAEDLIRLKSQCTTKVSSARVLVDGRFVFPTMQRPTESYKTGMRAFKASRAGGRLHAAVDLYRNHADPVIAVTTGTVIRGRYAFYQGTYALEIKHSDGKVIRYGEVTGTAAPGVAQGSAVLTGQKIAFVGTVNSGCCSPMLHFEMYSGKANGALSQSGNKFQRRSDLIDPTILVNQWEKAQFGISY